MMKVEPTWKRIGLAEPLPEASGLGISIIILDDIIPHVSLGHLKGSVKQVEVDKDLNITCDEVFDAPLTDKVNQHTTAHGVMTLHLLVHESFAYLGERYTGLARSADFIFLPTSKPSRIKAGLEWILDQDWNAKIVLNLKGQLERGFVVPSADDPYVEALSPAMDSGLLIVTAGGNSKANNNLHSNQFWVIGGFNDKGMYDSTQYEQHPSVSQGLNGDGYFRPDILAPYTYIPLPHLSGAGLDYFDGTCGGATLVTGLSAYLMSIFPDLTSNDVRNVLVKTGDEIADLPAPIINGAKALEAIKASYRNDTPPSVETLVKVTDENQSLLSPNPLERALALTSLMKTDKLTRAEIWNHTDDESPMVKKVAIRGLSQPVNDDERKKYWERLHQESSELGVKRVLGIHVAQHIDNSRIGQVDVSCGLSINGYLDMY
ncbi:S8 family serine peptidase [Hazenella sp. IB182357]|uniref:S8 family serine peptidase n=2 Tax=Polycladospora coralii TaxID=2771432 RepID=A0A926NAQ0_9BACL|nr:S8 family serine peptidase [Polycladospora coralii]